jgi:alpha-N-arabinofuranosidase
MNHGGALITAGFLNMLIRSADIVPISNMTGLIEFGGIWQKKGRVFGTPAYYAFLLYSTADISTPVETRVTGVESYNVSGGSRRLPEITGVPYLDVVAARNGKGDKLTAFFLNRDLNRDAEVSVSLQEFNSAPVVRVRKLTADSIYAANDETTPEAVVPIEASVRVENGRVKYTFPRASITVLEFSAAP